MMCFVLFCLFVYFCKLRATEKPESNSLYVYAYMANKADSDSDSDLDNK